MVKNSNTNSSSHPNPVETALITTINHYHIHFIVIIIDSVQQAVDQCRFVAHLHSFLHRHLHPMLAAHLGSRHFVECSVTHSRHLTLGFLNLTFFFYFYVLKLIKNKKG